MTGAGAGPRDRGRRRVLGGFGAGLVLAALPATLPGPARCAELEPPLAEVLKLTGGRIPQASLRFRLEMPPKFANGYTVPLTFAVDSTMTPADLVRAVHILAPGNPYLHVATFHFSPEGGRARVSTRIRLAQPQFVHGYAVLGDGTTLLAKAWVAVETDGCAG